MFELLLLALGAIGLVYWNCKWISIALDSKKPFALRLVMALGGLVSVIVTILIAMPHSTGMLTTNHAIAVGAYLTFVVLPLAMVYCIPGIYALVVGWKNRKAILAKFTGGSQQ